MAEATNIAQLKSATTDQTPTKATTNPAVEALNKALSGIGQVLPQHITKERMAKLAFGMMRTNAKLASAARRNPASFVNAIMHSSKLGLEPGIDAHLVPYENRKQGTVEIQCIPDYRGLLKLARNSGEITSISIQIAYTNDTFDLSLGTDDKLTHKPKLDGDRGEPMLVYAVAKFRDGMHHVEWMPVADINKIRDGSQGYQNAKRYKSDNPWISSWEEMARKTLARRISKYLPRSIELQNAERLMDAGDKGVPVNFEGEFAVVDDETPQSPESANVDRETGEITAHTDDEALRAMERVEVPDQQADQGGPSDEELVTLIKRGDYDEARSLAGPKLDMVNGMITSHQKAQEQRPAQRRTANRTVAPE